MQPQAKHPPRTLFHAGRIPAYRGLSDEELRRRREEIAEKVNPLLLTLESLDDEIHARLRERRRERILTPPPADCDDEEIHTTTEAAHV